MPLPLDKKLKAAQVHGEKMKLSFDQIAIVQQKIIDGSVKTAYQIKLATAESIKMSKSLEAAADAEKTILDIASKLQKPFDRITNATQSQLTNEIDLAKAMKQKIKDSRKAGTMTAILARNLYDGLNSSIKMNEAIKKVSGNKGLVNAFKIGSDAADNVQSQVDGLFSGLPGGSKLSSIMGFDKIGEDIKSKLTANLMSFGSAAKGSIGPMKLLGATTRAVTAAMMANPLILVVASAVALVALLGKALSIASDFNKKARETAEVQGTTVMAMKQQALEAHNVSVSQGLVLANTKDILAVQAQVAESFGSSYAISADIAGQIAETGKAFGVGVKASADFTANLMAAGASGFEAQQMLQSIGAELLGTGLNAGAVIEDISKNAKLTGKYFKGSVKQLKKAAIEAAKMGVSLDTMASVSDGLLDIEGSITAQYELQALTGKQMNLDKARQLALEGKTAEATKLVVSQMGSLADLQKMGPIQMGLLEKTTGMSADQMLRAATIQEKMPKMRENELKLLEAQGLSISAIADMSDQERQTALADADKQAKLQKSMDKMRAKMMKTLLPIGESLLATFEAMSPALDIVSGIFSAIAKPVKFLMKAMSTVYDLITASLPALATALVTFTAITLMQKKGLAYETGKAAVMLLQNTYTAVSAGLLAAANTIRSAGLIGSIGIAATAAWASLSAIPFVGAILGAAAAAAVVGLGMKYMSDGVISGKSGGSGYGDRTMFGPEGAISFNNKDTIVAGTNLFGNDVISPPGKMRLADDFASDMPDPPETKVVGISAAAAMKIGIGVATGLSTQLVPAMVMGLAAAVPALIAGMVVAVTAGNVAAFVATAPMLLATLVSGITAGMVAAAVATAFIPKPVLVMNPILPTLETNPILIGAAMSDMMGGFLGSMFGGGKDDPNEKIIAKLDEVVSAINSMDIQMDGERVGTITRMADSFRSKTRS